MILEETPDGYVVKRSGDLLSKTIAFRLSAGHYADIRPFLESFPQRSWAAAMRWLLSDERVRAVMAERVRSTSKRKKATS